jgi:hypothetical protein
LWNYWNRRASVRSRPSTTIITEFSSKNPRARIPEMAFPEPYLFTKTENNIINDRLELLNKHGLDSRQSQNLLERLGRIVEMGQ